MATCSLCAEEHPEGATTCPHCGARLVADDRPRWSGDVLVLSRSRLAAHASGCVVCGAGGAVLRARQVSRAPSWIFATLLLGLLGPCGLLLLTLILFRSLEQASVVLPLCGRCLGRWRRGDALLWGFGVVGLVGCPALGLGLANLAGLGPDEEAAAGLAGAFAWAFALAGLYHGVHLRLQVRCASTTFDEVCLAFPDLAIAQRVIEAEDGPWRAGSPGANLAPGGRGAELPLLRRGDREGDEEVPPLR